MLGFRLDLAASYAQCRSERRGGQGVNAISGCPQSSSPALYETGSLEPDWSHERK